MAIYKNDIFLVDTDSSATTTKKIGYDPSSGTVKRIYLNATSINYDSGVFLQVPDQPAKDTAASYNTVLAYGDFVGIDNPMITVEGVIDLGTYSEATGIPINNESPTLTYTSTTGSSVSAYAVTVKFLQLIRKCGHIFTLYDYYHYGWTGSAASPKNGSSDNPIYRMHTLTGAQGSEIAAPITVMCTGVSIQCSTNVDEGVMIAYSLKFKEVRAGNT